MDNYNSEKYRKYLISIKTNGNNKLAIWGTDMSDNEEDKFLANINGEILLFDSKREITETVSVYNEIVFDSNNFMKWVGNVQDEIEYASYDIDNLEKVLIDNRPILKEGFKDDCIDLLSFMDLCGDYAYQFSDDSIKRLIENQNTSIFRDYVYSVFLWNEINLRREKAEKAIENNFDDRLFRNEMKNLIELFKTKLNSEE